MTLFIKKVFFVLAALLISGNAISQNSELPFGKITLTDLDMKTYQNDTSVAAVVLNELGEAHVSQDDQTLVFEHYQKIKILKRRGFDQANFSIPLYKQESNKERLLSVVASTYNLNGVSLQETKVDEKNVFTSNLNQYVDLVKFTLPDIREGSVIEVKYKLSSPFVANFRTWEFQSDIPKVHSEYRTLIPANFVYNITLRGFLKLKEEESSLVPDCYDLGGGRRSDCAKSKYAVDDIPPFVEEDHMTAKSNFVSALHFELSEYKYFDGRVDKRTKEWKDVDQELDQHEDFGKQIKKARKLWEEKSKTAIAAESDDAKKAKAIYDLVKAWYRWNDHDGKYAEFGAKKSFETQAGNVGDINLSLVGALQSAGLEAFPLILSTRDNGTPIDFHPVISDFNYVIAMVEIKGVRYLLDATSSLQPFGFLPMRCLNGKGRLMSKTSSWFDLKPSDKQKTTTTIEMTLTDDGSLRGNFALNYFGYNALKKRGEIISAGERSQYIKQLSKEIEISNYQLENLEELEKPLIEKMDVNLATTGGGANTIYVNPFNFVTDKWERNPFKSHERLYPVDFGAPIEEVLIFKLNYPATLEVDELPEKVGLALPQNGGRYVSNVTNTGSQLLMVSNLSINKSVYNSTEYHYLRELFDRVIQAQQAQIVFKKK